MGTPIQLWLMDIVHTLTETAEPKPGGRWIWVKYTEYIALLSTTETAVSVALLCPAKQYCSCNILAVS